MVENQADTHTAARVQQQQQAAAQQNQQTATMSSVASGASPTIPSQRQQQQSLVWTNMQYFMSSLPQSASQQQQQLQSQTSTALMKPTERWGHSSVCAYDRKMIIIGGYQGKSNQTILGQQVNVVGGPSLPVGNHGLFNFQVPSQQATISLSHTVAAGAGGNTVALGGASQIQHQNNQSEDQNNNNNNLQLLMQQQHQLQQQPRPGRPQQMTLAGVVVNLGTSAAISSSTGHNHTSSTLSGESALSSAENNFTNSNANAQSNGVDNVQQSTAAGAASAFCINFGNTSSRGIAGVNELLSGTTSAPAITNEGGHSSNDTGGAVTNQSGSVGSSGNHSSSGGGEVSTVVVVAGASPSQEQLTMLAQRACLADVLSSHPSSAACSSESTVARGEEDLEEEKTTEGTASRGAASRDAGSEDNDESDVVLTVGTEDLQRAMMLTDSSGGTNLPSPPNIMLSNVVVTSASTTATTTTTALVQPENPIRPQQLTITASNPFLIDTAEELAIDQQVAQGEHPQQRASQNNWDNETGSSPPSLAQQQVNSSSVSSPGGYPLAALQNNNNNSTDSLPLTPIQHHNHQLQQFILLQQMQPAPPPTIAALLTANTNLPSQLPLAAPFAINNNLVNNNQQQQQQLTNSSSNNIGQYLGDIWEFDFTRCAYAKHKVIGEDALLLQRSNHTAIFYEPHNAIYVFGGGQAQRLRFNDTLKLSLPKQSSLQTTSKQAADLQPAANKANNQQPTTNGQNSQSLASSGFGELIANNIAQPQQPLQQSGDNSNSHCSSSHSASTSATESVTTVTKLALKDEIHLPCPRTYHASCLIGKYMIVSGGEANNTDLNDMWALDLENSQWFKLELLEGTFTSKRFHTVSSVSKNRVVSFGGCHSEYVHLNDVNIFDLSRFIESDGHICQVICQKLDLRSSSNFGQIPSTRWGHAAAVYEDKLYILGGRNHDDINDLHCFDVDSQKWSLIEIGHPMPKPRRRHSAVFVSSSLVMFGGFDGEFFNDLHILNFGQDYLRQVHRKESSTSLLEDYAKLVDSKEHSNIKFQLDNTENDGAPGADIIVHANKSLVLFRLFEREVREYCQDSRVFNMRMEEVLSSPQTKQMCPQFFQRVFDAKMGQTLRLPGISTRKEFLIFLEFCYCDKLVTPVTGAQISSLRHICQVLGLSTVTQYFDSLAQHIHNKLRAELVRDFEAKLMQQLGGVSQSASLLDNTGNPASNLTLEQRIELDKCVHKLLQSVKFNFDQLESTTGVQSPEDRIEKQNHIIHSEMVKCRNLDHFFDVVFELDGRHLMRANSAVLHARCEYFRIMFDSKYGFQESSRQDLTLTNQVRHSGVRYVVVRGIPKQYFTAIIQFLYTDNFCQTECNLAFFLRLLIYADYFMIGRLADLCQNILRQFVKPKNVMDLYLVAHAHNAARLESYCINFLAINQTEIQKSAQWKDFQRKCRQYERTCLLTKVREELDQEISRNYVCISLQRYVQKVSKADWPRFDFGQVSLDHQGGPPSAGSSIGATNSSRDVLELDDCGLETSKNGLLIATASAQSNARPMSSRDGIITIVSSPVKKTVKNKRSPSNRREPTIPAIVKVATGVTSRIVEPSIFTEDDLDQIMSVPNYIYFEEHYPLECYDAIFRKPQTTFRPFNKLSSSYDNNSQAACFNEEVQDEGILAFGGFQKPNHNMMFNNFMGRSHFHQLNQDTQFGNEEEDSENQNPNAALGGQQTQMIQTGAFKKHIKKEHSSALSKDSTQRNNLFTRF